MYFNSFIDVLLAIVSSVVWEQADEGGVGSFNREMLSCIVIKCDSQVTDLVRPSESAPRKTQQRLLLLAFPDLLRLAIGDPTCRLLHDAVGGVEGQSHRSKLARCLLSPPVFRIYKSTAGQPELFLKLQTFKSSFLAGFFAS
jgi:hypothetical protein